VLNIVKKTIFISRSLYTDVLAYIMISKATPSASCMREGLLVCEMRGKKRTIKKQQKRTNQKKKPLTNRIIQQTKKGSAQRRGF
jgi:hypothetical protein